MTDNSAPGVPAWFGNTVIEGVQLLVILALPGTPPAETISATALAWIESLWGTTVAWDERADRQRLHVAFRELARAAERWPAPAQLLKMLPQRKAPPALPQPEPDLERTAQARKACKALADSLRLKPPSRGYDAQAINKRMQKEAARNEPH